MKEDFFYRGKYKIVYRVSKDWVNFSIYIWDSEGLRDHYITGGVYYHHVDTPTDFWEFKKYAIKIADGIKFKD